jgi:hypothetical protein
VAYGSCTTEHTRRRYGRSLVALSPPSQASTFDEAGRAWVAPPPWEPAAAAAGGGRWVSDERQLPAEVRAALKSLRSAASQGGGEQVLGA